MTIKNDIKELKNTMTEHMGLWEALDMRFNILTIRVDSHAKRLSDYGVRIENLEKQAHTHA